jgi:uncharacterized protein YjbI with pentapeptide repeats/thioredoxin-like negative regulator of GroEL
MADDKKATDLKNAKLAKADLTGRDLRGADMTGANLNKATLTDQDLTGAELSKANLQDAACDNLVLDNARLGGAKLRGVWSGAKGAGADFANANGAKWELVGATFTDTSFAGLSVRRFKAGGGAFTRCDFTKAALPDAVFEDCTFTECNFTGADISCPNISRTKFVDCVFSNTDLSGPVMQQAAFPGCDLSRADLIAGEFKDVDLADAKLGKANFRYARGFSEETMAVIAERGGRVSRKLLRKALRAAVMTKGGRIAAVVLLLAMALMIHLHLRTPSNWESEKLFAEAAKAREAKQPELALQYFNILLERNPDDDITRHVINSEIAATMIDQERYEDALEIYRALIEVPTIDEVVKLNTKHEILRVLHLKGENDAVIEGLVELGDVPQFSQHMFDLLGQIIGHTQNPDDLRKILDGLDRVAAKMLEGPRATVYFHRGVVLGRLDRRAEAIEQLKQIETIAGAPPDLVRQSMMQLASQYQRDGQVKMTRAIYARMRERFPDATREITYSKLNEATIAQAEGHLEDAAKIYREIMDRAPDELSRNSARLGLAGVMLNLKNFDEAVTHATEVHKNTDVWQPHHVDAAIILAGVYSERGDVERAVKLLTEIIEESADERSQNIARREMINVMRRGGRFPEAIALMEKELEADQPDEQRVMNLAFYAEMLATVKDYGRATDALEKAIALSADGQSMGLVQRYVTLLTEAGMLQYAVKYLNDVIEKNPSASTMGLWARLEMVNLERREGRMDAANEWMRKIVKLNLTGVEMPGNFLNATWANDPEGKKLTLEFLRKIAETNPPDNFTGGHSRLVLANKLTDEGEKEDEDWAARAEALAREVAAANGDVNLIAHAYDTLGRLYQQQGNLTKVAAVFKEMEERTTDVRVKSLAFFGRGKALIEKGDVSDGLKLLRQARETCTDRDDCCKIAFTYGQKLVAADQRAEAKEVFGYIRDELTDCWSRDEAIVMLDSLE